jgi:hypothetical protein
MPRRVALLLFALVGCNESSPAQNVSSGSSPGSPSPQPHDAAVPADTTAASSSEPDPELLREATAYVGKLRAIPRAIRSVKNPPARCAADMLTRVSELQRPAFVVDYATLQKLADEEVDYSIDRTHLMMNFQSTGVTVFVDTSEHERGKRSAILGFGQVKELMLPFAVVVRADKLDHPLLADGNKYWPGAFRGSVHVVDIATATVLCGGKLTFASPPELETTIEAKTAVTHDFLERGRNAVIALVAKQAPGLRVVRWRQLTSVR